MFEKQENKKKKEKKLRQKQRKCSLISTRCRGQSQQIRVKHFCAFIVFVIVMATAFSA